MNKKKISLNEYGLKFSLGDNPVIDPISESRKMQKTGTLFNDFLKALGVWEERRYFKGDIDESEMIQCSNSYMLYEEDCEEVLELFKKGHQTAFIRTGDINTIIENGSVKKDKLQILRKTVNLFIKLFEKYCKDKSKYEEIKYRINAATKIELLEALDTLNDTKNYVAELINPDIVNRDLDTVAAYGIDEKDIQCWAVNFSKEIKIFMDNWNLYRNGMKLYRENEFNEKLDRLTEKEKEELNDFIELLSEKLKEQKIMRENDSISNATTLYSGKEKINKLNQSAKVKQILTQLNNHPGFQLYTNFFNAVESSEKVLEYMRNPDNYFLEMGKKLSNIDILM